MPSRAAAPLNSLARAEDKLRDWLVMLPAAGTLERIVVAEVTHATTSLFETSQAGCRHRCARRIDLLVEVPEGDARSSLFRLWGDGSRSSSDGQRFAVQRDSLLSSFYPRYFGYYDRALALYTHTSDLHSVYATLAISCAPREARYVLSGILDNDTTLAIREHTSDTHGFTEHLFGLCALLGIALMPRLKDFACPLLPRAMPTRCQRAAARLFRISAASRRNNHQGCS